MEVDITSIYFTVGVPPTDEVDNILAAHLKSRRDLVKLFYNTLKAHPLDPIISRKIRPLRDSFFINTLIGEEIVQKKFGEALELAKIKEIQGSSLTYIARKVGSFKKMYEKFAEEVFRPAVEPLETDEDIQRRMLKGLEKIKSLE